LCLLEAGHDVVVIDNISNSAADSIARISKLAGRPIALVVGDVRERALLK
jgi:UDP-glucose 4-epimerase